MSDEERRLGRLLRTLVWGQLAAFALWAVIAIALYPESTAVRLVMVGAVAAISAVTLALERRGRWQLGAALMVGAFWIALAYRVADLGTVADTSWYLFAILVGEAGLLLGARAAATVTVASAIHGAVVVLLLDRALLLPAPAQPLRLWASGVLLFALIAVLQLAAVRLYRGGLEQARLAARRHRTLFDGAPLPLWEADLQRIWDWLTKRDLIGKPDAVKALLDDPALVDEVIGLISVIDANQAALQQAGRTLEDVRRGGISHANRRAVLPIIENLVAGAQVMQHEIKLELAGQHRWIVVRAELPDDRDRLRNVVVSFTDVTDQRLLAEEREQAQRLESLARLAGGIAHDFNNLLTVTRMNADHLVRRVPAAEGRELVRIGDAITRATALTRQLLLFSRRDVAQPQVIAPDRLLAELEPLLRRTIDPQIALTVEHDDPPAAVSIDPAQLEQLVLNLALNAADAMPDGGALRIARGRREVGSAEADPALRGLAPGRYLSIVVSDTGPGMTAEARSRAFEPFFTTRPGKRAGLGLSIVHGIAGQAGGAVLLASPSEGGTRVEVVLPEATPIDVAATVTVAAAGGERILLVEDEDGVREIAQATLEDAGYHVVAVRDGHAALAAFGGGDGVDLVVSDLVMPGIGGGELVRRLRTTRPSLPVLCMSGHAVDGPPRLDGDARVGFLAKPFTAQQLLASVRSVLPAV